MGDIVRESAVLLQALRHATLSEEQARQLFRQGEEAVVFALLELTKQLAEARSPSVTPSTPSGMMPTYQKPAKSKRGKTPGAKKGHRGCCGERCPSASTGRSSIGPKCCPDCGGRLQRCQETRMRYTEDIPEFQPEVTEHTIHRDWCPTCKKKVEPPVPDALPGSTLGHRVLVLSAWLHYALGNTLSQIVEVFNFHLQMKITDGGLVQMWYRLQAILYAWYEQIQQEALHSAVLHGDETGWRIDGKTHWLWCFGNQELTYFMIDRSRGSPALAKFFIEEFAGTLGHRLLGRVQRGACAAGRRAWCICCANWSRPRTTSRRASTGQRLPRSCVGWSATPFACGGARTSFLSETHVSRRQRLDARLAEMIEADWQDLNARRLVKRLSAASERLVHVSRSSRSSL